MDTQAPQYTPSTGNGTRSGNWLFTNGAWRYSPQTGSSQSYSSSSSAPTPYTSPSYDHPVIQTLIKNDPQYAAIMKKLQESGDSAAIASFQSVLDGRQNTLYSGTPVTAADFEAEIAKQMANPDFNQYYNEKQAKDRGDIEANLGLKQREYDRYLGSQASEFGQQKDTQDKTAADNGVLFSSGRVQKLSDLKNTFDSNAASMRDRVGTDIGNTAREYQYKYGNDSANSLSSYYGLGSQSYNPNVAHGATNSGGIGSVYSPSSNNFFGTVNSDKYKNAAFNASQILTSRGNKLNRFGYQYQI